MIDLDLQQSLRRIMTLGGLPQSAVARGANVSTAVVSQFLNSTPDAVLYKGDLSAVQKKIARYVERETARIMAPQPPAYLPIENATQVADALRLAHIERVMCVVVGPPGSGKTFALREYAREMGADVVLVTANPSWRVKALVAAICAPLGIQPNLPAYSLVERVIETLRGSGRIIAIDEAQSLSYEALEVVRAIHDRAGVGVALCGMARLHDNMIGRGRGLYAHLYSRVSKCVLLTNEISEEDVAIIVRAVFPVATKTEIALFSKIANESGRLRTLVQTLCHLRRTADLTHEPLSADMIRETRRMLMVVS